MREDRLVTITDIFATVGEIAGADFDGSIHDSVSFAGFLASEEGIDRPYAFSDIDRNGLCKDRCVRRYFARYSSRILSVTPNSLGRPTTPWSMPARTAGNPPCR